MAPFTIAARRRCRRPRRPTSASTSTRARPRSSSRRSAPTSARTSSPGVLATGLTLDRRVRLFIDVGTNSEIVLGSSAEALATAAPAGPGVRGGADPLRHARRRRRDRGREDPRRRGRADRDRRRRAGRALRLGARRRRRRARRRRRSSTTAASSSPTARSRAARQDRRGERLPPRRRRLPLAARRARAAVREGVDRDRLDDPLPRARASSRRRSRRCCSPARSAPTSRAASAVRIGLVPKLPLTRIVSAGNVAGEGAKIAALSVQERAAATRGARRGRVRRALGPRRLQRPVHRPARVPGMTRVVVACGALALHVNAIAQRRGWELDVRPLPPELHNRPERIAPAVAEAAHGDDVVVAYADCGTRGALDGLRRLEGAHCYELYGGELDDEPGTLLPDRLPGPRVRPRRRARARPRPPPRAARRLLPQLHARRLARAAADAGAARAGRARRRDRSGCRSRCARPATRGLETALERLMEESPC